MICIGKTGESKRLDIIAKVQFIRCDRGINRLGGQVPVVCSGERVGKITRRTDGMFEIDAATRAIGVRSKMRFQSDKIIGVALAIGIEAGDNGGRIADRIRPARGFVHPDFPGETDSGVFGWE